MGNTVNKSLGLVLQLITKTKTKTYNAQSLVSYRLWFDIEQTYYQAP